MSYSRHKQDHSSQTEAEDRANDMNNQVVFLPPSSNISPKQLHYGPTPTHLYLSRITLYR